MKAEEVAFQELLNSKVQYRVPLFQRTYSWAQDNWERLWSDIREIYRLSVPRSHFLGAVVTLPIPDSPEHASKHMLIDGQQRLTTLFVLLAALRDASSDAGLDELAEQINEECLLNKFVKRTEEKGKLLPTQADQDPFRAIMHGQKPSGENLLAGAKQFFDAMLRESDDDEQPLNLPKLKSCITDYLSLVSIRLDQDDSPYRIFESLNNTGMALSDADLIRNDIFMRMPSEEEQNKAYADYWLPMQNRLLVDQKSWMDQFFWRYAMKDGAELRKDEVYATVKGLVTAAASKGRTVHDCLSEFYRYSGHYMMIWLPAEHESDPEVRRCAHRLLQWDVDVAVPFLLNAYDLRDASRISSGHLSEVMRMIESFLVRRIVCGVPTNRLRVIFNKMAGAAQGSGDEFTDACRTYLGANNWPDDETFHTQFQVARLYIPSRLSRTRLILESLEESYQHLEQVALNEVITVEHVMPQTLDDEWRQKLGPSHADVHARLLHTIGNLTLTAYNPSLSNMAFGLKKPILQESHFELTRALSQHEEWTEDTIQARAKELAERAVKVWPR